MEYFFKYELARLARAGGLVSQWPAEHNFSGKNFEKTKKPRNQKQTWIFFVMKTMKGADRGIDR
jgi:hypothetical protein